MPGDLGKSQLSSLLETVPGLASVLRSPVADAIVNMVRAGAGLRDFDINDAKELVQYATRRGLIPSAEGSLLLEEVKGIAKKGQAKSKRAKKKTVKKTAAKKTTKKTAAKKTTKKTAAKKTTKKTAKKTVKKKAAKKAAGRSAKGRR
jgi:transposase